MPRTSNPVAAIAWGRLFAAVAAQYFSHLLIPSLILFFLYLPFADKGMAFFAILFFSAFLIGAAQSTIGDTEPIAELGLWRAFYRALAMLSTTVIVGLFVAVGMFVFGIAGAALLQVSGGTQEMANPMFVAIAALLTAFALLRFWPVYIVQYLYRGTQGDFWAETGHIKLPDMALSVRLTAPKGAMLRANIPAVLLSAIWFAAYLAIDAYLPPAGAARRSAEIAFFFALTPLVHVLLVERGIALAEAAGSARAAAEAITGRGPLWFLGFGYWRAQPADAAGEGSGAQADGRARAQDDDRARAQDADRARAQDADARAAGGTRAQPEARADRAGRSRPSSRSIPASITPVLDALYRHDEGISRINHPRDKLTDDERQTLAEACFPSVALSRPWLVERLRTLPEGLGHYLKNDQLVLHAAALLREERPGLDPFEARLRVIEYYQQRSGRRTWIGGEELITWRDEPVRPPEIPKEYRELTKLPKERFEEYWEEPAYQELVAKRADKISAGAIRAVIPLLNRGLTRTSKAFENWPEPPVTADELVIRVGGTAFIPLAAHLINPRVLAPDLEHPPQFPVDVIVKMGRPAAEPLLRAGLSSGWIWLERIVADLPWGNELLAEFEETPYDEYPRRP